MKEKVNYAWNKFKEYENKPAAYVLVAAFLVLALGIPIQYQNYKRKKEAEEVVRKAEQQKQEMERLLRLSIAIQNDCIKRANTALQIAQQQAKRKNIDIAPVESRSRFSRFLDKFRDK